MSFLLRIQSQIETTIGAINQDSGYNFDWGSVNQRGDQFCTFPSAWFTFTSEEGLNEIDETFAESYSNSLNVRLTVKTELEGAFTDPRYENRSKLYQALEDIKKAFANGTIEDAGVLPPMYISSEIIDSPDRDVFRPSHIIINFKLTYDQDRDDPSQVACS